ncbi:MAG: polysaccharide deacetylase family protein [Clostridia bacterium]|nr:polysaccharide deacetylase family protein [Clostridia bacterium]
MIQWVKDTIKKFLYKIPSSAILIFHHISESPKICKSGCLLSFDKFKFIIEKYNNYGDLISVVKKPYKRKIAVTFDDALQDVYELAYPYLKKLKIPFTIFVITDFIDTEGYITTEQLKTLAADPLVTIGSHGASHKVLNQLTPKEQKDEIEKSKIILEDIIKKEIKLFAFSHGAYNKDVLKMLKSYSFGFSTNSRPLNFITGLRKKAIPRYNIDSYSYETMKKKLSKIFDN